MRMTDEQIEAMCLAAFPFETYGENYDAGVALAIRDLREFYARATDYNNPHHDLRDWDHVEYFARTLESRLLPLLSTEPTEGFK